MFALANVTMTARACWSPNVQLYYIFKPRRHRRIDAIYDDFMIQYCCCDLCEVKRAQHFAQWTHIASANGLVYNIIAINSRGSWLWEVLSPKRVVIANWMNTIILIKCVNGFAFFGISWTIMCKALPLINWTLVTE